MSCSLCYTGEIDVNGHKIYLGDKFDCGYDSVVEWTEEYGFYVHCNHAQSLPLKSYIRDYTHKVRYAVIGNVIRERNVRNGSKETFNPPQ